MNHVEFLADSVSVEAVHDEKLIAICERSGASIPFGCASGSCGTCLVKITGAAGSTTEVTEQEKQTLAIYAANPEEGYRLACQCKVRGNISVDLP